MKDILIIGSKENRIRNILQMAGYNAELESDGKKGVEIALYKQPDLIVCETELKDVDAYSVIHALKNSYETASIPLIYVTHTSDLIEAHLGMEKGADDYLLSPFKDNVLLEIIK